ncbi:hypothetical protein Kfla_3245 [Kribbella flavida DSM 17836]|uniref:Uncharacterized protein n=1 Tax=Kribbella flavida (strain DSM 17836 / JCM 10339 / NBRC 14399) TaxID=479435 RepID=D2Q4J3_KRIFD|nr:hypothetical protein [Kribbella flavida]ADB32307.1 hypothetical protein Kfla_3245 [Kribbella flavida DSM 17836]
MKAREYLFLRTSESVQAVAEWIQQEFALEPIPNGSDDEDEIGLRGPARTADATVGYEVMYNIYPVHEPEPDEIQAIDTYPVEIDIWLGKDEGTQGQEARLVFEHLIKARPDVPILLCHELSDLIAAYVPGRGVHEFPDPVTIYAGHADAWRDWVPA